MVFDLYPNSKPFNMLLSFRILRPVKLHISVYDRQTKRIYADRRLKLDKSGGILIKLPIVPEELTAKIYSPGEADQFTLEKIKVLPDTHCPLSLSASDKNFIRFIKWFATRIESLEAGEKGTLYQSEGFSILLLDTIKEGNIELTTPARIARTNGIIEVSKKTVKDYTVPMIMVMLLHEYAHKYKNPEYGKEVENEITADIIAAHIALNLGFDPGEVAGCFRAVFAKKDTDLNRRRMGAVEDFIRLFNRDENKRCNINDHASRPK
jgi:hypothetical protein